MSQAELSGQKVTMAVPPSSSRDWSPKGLIKNYSLLDQSVKDLHRVLVWNQEMFSTSSVVMGVKLLHTLESQKEATVNSGKLENIFQYYSLEIQKHFNTSKKNKLFHNLTLAPLHVVPCLGKVINLYTLWIKILDNYDVTFLKAGDGLWKKNFLGRFLDFIAVHITNMFTESEETRSQFRFQRYFSLYTISLVYLNYL